MQYKPTHSEKEAYETIEVSITQLKLVDVITASGPVDPTDPHVNTSIPSGGSFGFEEDFD